MEAAGHGRGANDGLGMLDERAQMSPAHEHHERRWELLGNRNFMLLWCAYGISAMGDHLSELAILAKQGAMNTQVDITPLTARMTFAFFLPFFVLGPLAGMLADRLPRRALMIAADLARCVLMFFFATLIGWTQGWTSWGPFLPLLMVGVFAALFSPARSSLLPRLVLPQQLIRANGMIAGLGIIATMCANLLSGYLAHRELVELAFRLDAATFLASAILLACMRLRHLQPHAEQAREEGSSVRQLGRGFHYAGCHRRVLELLAVASLIWFCGALVNTVIPAIARDVYKGTLVMIGAFRMFWGLGFIIGAALVVTLGNALRSEIAITWALFGIAVSIGMFAASVFLPFSPGALAVIGAVGVISAGAFGVAVVASFNSLLQRIVPDRYRGRVFGVLELCTTAALLAATGPLGLPQEMHIDRWVGYILVVVALATFAAGAVTLSVRLRRSPHRAALTIAWNFVELLAKFWWRLERVGRPTVPRQGPVVIAANHVCPPDPLFLTAALPYRAVAFLSAAEFSNFPIARWFMHLVECIPVRREEHDVGAMKQAMRHLQAGKVLGIFIEGRMVPPGETVAPKEGAAILALTTGATVIPAHISGGIYYDGIVRGFLARHRAKVRFGPPVDLSEFRGQKIERQTLRAATRKIFAAIQALAPEGECGMPNAECGNHVTIPH